MLRLLKDKYDNARALGIHGFTLVELLVTISIFAVVTGIVMYNQTRFNSTIFLTNLAYDVSLTIRQAQTYGVNVRRFEPKSGIGTTDFNKPYGVHFSAASGDSKVFVLYADIDGNRTLTLPVGASISDVDFCSTNDECLQLLSIKRGNYIKDIRIKTVGGLETVSASTDPTPRTLDITFRRPDPDAIITTYPALPNTIVSATVTLGSVDDPSSLRYVKVNTTGQISVEKTP